MRSTHKQKNTTISNVKSFDLWSGRAEQIRTCRGKAPPSCLRKTVLLLKSPTGAFVASQTQTFFSAIGGQSVLKPDSLGSILVVERDQHPVIVQKNGIDKNFNQRFSLLFLRNIELSKFHQPESDEILIEARLLQLFVCNFAVSSSFWISSASRRSFVVRVYKPSSIAFIRLSNFLLTSRSCFSSSGIVVFS